MKSMAKKKEKKKGEPKIPRSKKNVSDLPFLPLNCCTKKNKNTSMDCCRVLLKCEYPHNDTLLNVSFSYCLIKGTDARAFRIIYPTQLLR